MKAPKFANLVKAFLKNYILHECKLFKEELLAYHENQKNNIDMFILNYMRLNSSVSKISYVIVYVYYYYSFFKHLFIYFWLKIQS